MKSVTDQSGHYISSQFTYLNWICKDHVQIRKQIAASSIWKLLQETISWTFYRICPKIRITTVKEKSLLKYIGPNIWTNIPQSIKNSMYLKVFINTFRIHLIGNYTGSLNLSSPLPLPHPSCSISWSSLQYIMILFFSLFSCFFVLFFFLCCIVIYRSLGGGAVPPTPFAILVFLRATTVLLMIAPVANMLYVCMCEYLTLRGCVFPFLPVLNILSSSTLLLLNCCVFILYFLCCFYMLGQWEWKLSQYNNKLELILWDWWGPDPWPSLNL